MKKILFLTRGYFPESSSGLNVIKKITENLTSSYHVDVFALYSYTGESSVEEYNSVRIYRNRKKRAKFLAKIAGKLDAIYRGWPSINIEHIKTAVKALEKIIEKNRYDVLISVCHPFETHVCACLNAKKPIKWIAYYLDPYFSNKQLPANKYYIRKYTEKKILQKADCIILQSTVFDDYQSAGFKNIMSIEFPSIYDFDLCEKSDVLTLDDKYINCVYTGALYNDIRNPEYLLQLWRELKNQTIRLYLIGGTHGFEENYFVLWKQKLRKRLIVLDRMQEAEINHILDQADILVNIGNAVSNQLPGKVFDYISVRKPIINLCKLRECPSLKYLSHYPICLHIFEEDKILKENSIKAEDFIMNNRKKRLPYKEIQKIYTNYTQDKVLSQFEEIIQSVVSKI